MTTATAQRPDEDEKSIDESGGRSRRGSGLVASLKAKPVVLVAILTGLVASGGALALLGKSAATTTYFVLGQAVATRTQIMPGMLVPVKVSVGGQPRNALDLTYVRSHTVFAKTPLQAGDVISASTVGSLEQINKGLPSGFVAASFQVTPDNAVAGKVRTGNYIDIIAVNNVQGAGSTAKVVLSHVRVLDVVVNPQNISEAANGKQVGDNVDPGPESSAVRGGIPTLYVVGLSQVDATKLALIRDRNLMVVLSPNNPASKVDASSQMGDVFRPGEVGDSGAGTEGVTTDGDPGTTAPSVPSVMSVPSGSTGSAGPAGGVGATPGSGGGAQATGSAPTGAAGGSVVAGGSGAATGSASSTSTP